MTCLYIEGWMSGRQISEHSGWCRKCRLSNQARGLDIQVHKWPLLEKELDAKAVIFEVDVPDVISS